QGDNGGFMVRDDAEEFSQKVIALLSDSALHEQKATEALAWGNRWKISSLTPHLIGCYKEAISIRKKKETT
ncbi:MAG: glycosyltransferase family 4 protein, partial [Treponemataceae bacterium]|nr:glycosyltransferase family 4 protein [Treponemataceae bacterium]